MRAASAPRFSLSSFRTKLMLLVLLPMIPLLFLALHRHFQQRKAEREKLLERITTLSKLIAANEGGYFKNARQLMTTLSGISFLVRANDKHFCAVHFQNLLKLSPDYLNFGLIESNGVVFVSALSSEGATNYLGDRSYFRRTLRSKGFSVGDFQTGRISQQKSVNFAYPILDEKGTLMRVLFASLKLDLFKDTARLTPLPPGAVVLILDRSGKILARLPEDPGLVGEDLGNPLAQKILGLHEGVFEGKGVDNIERAYAVSSVSDDDSDGMKVAVGMRTDLLFADTDAAGKGNLIVLGLVMILALGASSLIAERSLLEPVDALMQAANRFASADFSARAKVSRSTAELYDLSEAFNSMAERLEQRESELRKAHSEIQSINTGLEEKIRERTSELVAANREMEAFTYSVSHDLRAPLRHLDGFAQMLVQQRAGQLDATAQRYLDVISRSAKTMGTLIDDLLVFSRMGKQELNRKNIEMGKVVAEAVSDLQLDAKGRKVEWIVEELPIVKADGNLIRQVWANLLGNALKYTRPKEIARIEVGYRKEAGEHCFYVRDNGVGFDAQYADKLFGVFHRLHSDSEFEGTGIGLANVKRIVQRHGGRVWGESVLGESATFYFTLPANENEAA